MGQTSWSVGQTRENANDSKRYGYTGRKKIPGIGGVDFHYPSIIFNKLASPIKLMCLALRYWPSNANSYLTFPPHSFKKANITQTIKWVMMPCECNIIIILHYICVWVYIKHYCTWFYCDRLSQVENTLAVWAHIYCHTRIESYIIL